MNGSTAAQFYSMPYTSAMTSHIVNASYSNNDNGVYLTSSMGAGPSTQSNANVNGENTPGSTKRPFPWASSESQERDKRPRGGSGNATTSSASEDPEETMSTDESAYASAAESPNPNFSRSPTRADWPLSTVDESETRTLATAPRIPTPAALRSSSPLQLPNLSLSIQSGFRPVSPPTTTSVNTPLRLVLPPRSIPPNNVSSSEPRTQPLDLGWLTQQLDEALPPPRDRAFSLSFGSASVDSALPHPQHSRAGSTRVPLPWVDIEGESIGSSLLAASELASTSVSASLEIESESGSLGADSVAESVTSSPGAASTVRSDHSPPTIAPATHSPLTATATRRPLSLNLRNFPLVPGPDSPSTAFPTSASPRTSAFDLAVTPPGSALPSFVARMMEVDSPVHGGGDSYISSQAGTFASSTDQAGSYAPPRSRTGTFTSSIPQTTYVPPPPPPQAESYPSSPHLDGGDASLDALRRFMRQESTTEPTHQAVNLVEHQNTGLLRQSEGESASSVSPNQAPTAVAVGSYFPPVRTDERQPHTGVPRGVQPYRGGYEQHLAQQTTRNTHPEQLSSISQEHFSGHTQLEEVARNGSIEQPSRTTHPSEDSNLDSIYSRRLTESGASFPSRPSDSGASLPSFRATVSPEPGRMSWSDFFGPRTPETGGSDVAISAGGSEITMGTRGSEISAGTRTSEVTTGMRSSEATMGTVSTRGAETGMNTRGTADIGTSTSRAGMRSALTRVVRLPGSEGPPRLHFDALPREDRSSATNLSRTPPGPDSHPTVWFEDDSTRPRRTSSTRWTDLFPEPASAPVPIIPRPTNRTRMPPPVSVSSTDSTVFDPLTGMSWNRNSQAVPEPSPAYDATSSLARYQTFAQSIDEIRRSPPPPQQGVSPEPNWGESGNNRTSWAFPRHEPPQYEVPPPTNGNWLREWESQRDRRSRAARDDYLRRQGSDYPSNDRRYHTEYANSDEVPRRPPMAQLSDTQAQGQLWPEFVAHSRPLTRPMTRASLVATGFADSDLWPENDESNTRLWGEIPRPARRQEILPAPVGDVAAPVQFLPSNHEAGVVFTESPPSLLGGFDDPNYSELIPGDAQPSRPDPINFRSASHVLRASLVDTSRRASDGPTRPLVAAEPERTRVSSRERWESHLTRSQVQLERVRQLLHRSHDSRERDASRRHLPESPVYPHRRGFLSTPDNEIPPSNTSSDSRRSSVSGVAWPRPGPTEVPPPRPFTVHEGDQPEWPPSDTSSRNNTITHELMRASSLRGRRRRTLLPESASRRDSTGFIHSVNNALNQVESGLLELSALANEGDNHMHHYGAQNEPESTRPHSPSRSGHMEWVYESTERNPTPPPTLPPFDFASAQRNPGWSAERYNQPNGGPSGLGLEVSLEYPSRRTPARGPDGYLEQRQNARDLSSTRGTRTSSYTHEGPWRSSAPSNEWWSNDVPPPNLPTHMPLRDRLLFRPSGGSHQPVASSRQPEPVNSRSSNMVSSMQTQPPSATFARLHRRRLSPPAPPHQPSVSSSLLRPFANQNNSTSPTRSHTSRFPHFLSRRNSGRGGGGGSSDDNDEWHHTEQATRRFFLRSRGRGRTQPANGDYLRDDEFDDSYEGLLRLAARIGDAKPRGTPAEVVRSMVSSRYADSPGAREEARCPICLDDYAPDDIVTVVKRCSHWFHRECVQQWLSNSRTCPVCRGQADGEEPEPQAGPSTGASDSSWV